MTTGTFGRTQVGRSHIPSLLVMLGVIVHIRPAVMSYFGFTLLFKLATLLVFAALSQMFVIMKPRDAVTS